LRNRVELTGVLTERKAQRLTPSGVPVTECAIRHESEQIEAGHPRHIECTVKALALGETSKWLEAAALGSEIQAKGFLAAGNQRGGQLKLHLTEIEFIEGNQNGPVFQKER
jgi:primosomal replication protein N